MTEKDNFGTTIRHPDGSVTRIYEGGSSTEYLDGTVIEKDASTGTVTVLHPDGSSSSDSRLSRSTDNRGSSSSDRDKKPSNNTSSSDSDKKPSNNTSSSDSDKKPRNNTSSSDSDKKPSNNTSSSDSDKKPSNNTSSSDSDKKPSNDTSSSDSDKKPSKEKLEGEGGSGLTDGDTARDIYNKLHKPGNADAPSNGGHVRGDVSQPGAEGSSGSDMGSKVGGHIQVGGSPVGVVTGNQNRPKGPLNMVDPARFGSGSMAPSNSASEQLQQRRDSINPDDR